MIKRRKLGGNVGISRHEEFSVCKPLKAMKSVRKDSLRQGAMKMTALEPKSTIFATLRVGYSWLDERIET